MSVLVHSPPISSRKAWTLGATLSSQTVLNLWWMTSRSHLSLRYTSAPLGSFHKMVLVCASKRGEEGSPAKYRMSDGGRDMTEADGIHGSCRWRGQCTHGRISGRKEDKKKG